MPAFVASQRWETPYTKQDFIAFAHERFLQHTTVAGVRELSGQQWGADRPFFQNLWYWLHNCAINTHTKWSTADKLRQDIHTVIDGIIDDPRCSHHGAYAVPGSNHPLYADPRKERASNRDGIPIYKIATNSYDQRLAKWMLKTGVVDRFISEAMPMLHEADPHARISQYSYDFRRKLQSVLPKQPEWDTAARMEMIIALTDEWMTMTQGNGMEALQEAEHLLKVPSLDLLPTEEAFASLRLLRTMELTNKRALECAGIELLTIVKASQEDAGHHNLQVTAAATRDFLQHYGRAWNQSPSLSLAHLSMYLRHASPDHIRAFISMR